MLVLVAFGLAQTPVGSFDVDGMARVFVVVPDGEIAVRAALLDPEAAAALPPEVLAVHTIASGACVTLGVTVKGAWDPLRYTAQRCPTVTGYRYLLLKSDTITRYEAEWSLYPHAGGGTEVTYRIRTEVDLPVPSSIIRQSVLVSAKDTVLALIKRISARR
ncbi:MAG: hypothetical protein EXR71_04085 [Myxococcales bacterium]|nr:hypothetical protein [Myxococcales bacterium]